VVVFESPASTRLVRDVARHCTTPACTVVSAPTPTMFAFVCARVRGNVR
jgi:hypothetical protein